ncbi:hypothetical protein E2P84_42425 [Burkholderia cepacia]|uniref:Uncharacterized protein n=1 Tax=Burkholderia cepacia TaxID=292 RepID=A0AAX2RQR7_BURCE|nr:hypothetical protein [Burkholderia cepacia]TES62181.1 hypothetical protein E2P84_42425 [Burkholderia cepacia]TET01627.1 hypothetical protein E3D36_16460 [Burkholderia cepacia]TEU47485.1 hypothetical protein E3D37_15890 [Burkholderia cepacia]TEU53512.1 hypothetical protein E3D38_12280 [Burkholderia cepacia]TEV02118.1 hypothetical protein E3D40_13210 [Burkholderia cepacia]
MKQISITADITSPPVYHGEAVKPVKSTVSIAVSDELYDHFGDVRAHVLAQTEADSVPFSIEWGRSDASVGDLKVLSVETAGDRAKRVEWLNKNFRDGDTTISIGRDSVQWEARFSDASEFSASVTFDQLQSIFERPTRADAMRALGAIAGYPADAAVGPIYRTDAKFAEAIVTLRPADVHSEWGTSRETVRYLLDEAAKLDARFALSARDVAVAVIRQFGANSPLVSTFKKETRFAEAVKVLAPGFETTHWRAEDTVASFLNHMDRKLAPLGAERAGLVM